MKRTPILALLAACGGQTTPPPVVVEPLDTADVMEDTAPADTAADDTDDTDVPPPPPERDCDTPSGVGLANFCDLSVNSARAILPTSAGQPLELQTDQSAATPPGSYWGSGTGNRAIAGFHGYSRKRLDTLSRIELDLERVVGPFTPPQVIMPEIGLVVDLSCTNGPYAYINVTWANLGPSQDIGDNRLRYTVLADQNKWTATNGLRTPDGTTVLLPDPDVPMGVDPGTLAAVLAAWPNACLRNRDIEDPFLPADTTPSAFLLTLGRSTTLIKVQWKVWRVQIDSDIHAPP